MAILKVFTDWFDRSATCAGEWGWTLDRLALLAIKSFFFIWLNRGEAPVLDYTMSAYTGEHAIEGEKWALVVEKIIDAVMGSGHCRAAWKRESASVGFR